MVALELQGDRRTKGHLDQEKQCIHIVNALSLRSALTTALHSRFRSSVMGCLRGEAFDFRGTVVCRSIIDNDDFVRRSGLFEDTVNCFFNEIATVVERNNCRNRHLHLWAYSKEIALP